MGTSVAHGYGYGTPLAQGRLRAYERDGAIRQMLWKVTELSALLCTILTLVLMIYIEFLFAKGLLKILTHCHRIITYIAVTN